MKYFITRATILSVYRESLKLCYQIKLDKETRDGMIDLMKDEFRPFRQAKDKDKLLTQEAVDYYLAKIRKRINEFKMVVNMCK